MTPEERAFVAQLCAVRAGLQVEADKAYLIESRLGGVARREGFASPSELLRALRERREERLAWAVIEALSLSEGVFFEERAAFELFAREILPEVGRDRGDDPVRIWSAGCGAGQEVYSLAMTVEEAGGDLPDARFELYASDISERAMEKAQAGLYTQFEVQRGLPIRLLVRHFEEAEGAWAISPRLRQMVRWRRLNLVAELPATGRFDVIFCRGVLSGMVEAMRPRLLENLAGMLAPGGRLVLGADESAAGLTDALQPAQGRSDLLIRNPAYRAAA